MVTKYTKKGNPYGQAPYTPEEEERLYRHLEGNDGPITIVYSGRLATVTEPLRRQSQRRKTTICLNDEGFNNLRRKETIHGHQIHERGTSEEEEHLDRHMDGGDGPFTIVWTGPAGNRYKAPPPPKPKQDDDDLLD